MHCADPQDAPESAATARLSFAVPAALILRTRAGRWMPNLHGVRLDVGSDGVVTIGGYDASEVYATRAVFDQARRFLEQISRGDLPPATVPAELVAASRAEPSLYSIIIGARVAIAPRERWQSAPLLVA